MNARDPATPPRQTDDGAVAARRSFADRAWDERDRAGAHRLHRGPGQEPDVRRRLAAARPHRPRGARCRRLGRARRRSPGLKLEVIRLEGRTPVIFFEVPATSAGSTDTVRDVRPPRQAARVQRLAQRPRARGRPSYENGLLYGRGGADDGYAVYAAITAIQALDAQGIAAPALRRPDRDLRGERLVRPAGLPRRAAAAPGRRRPGGLPRLRRRQLRPALAHHQRCAAWSAAR